MSVSGIFDAATGLIYSRYLPLSPTGPTGPAGAPGAPGAAGLPGAAGAPGPTGPSGGGGGGIPGDVYSFRFTDPIEAPAGGSFAFPVGTNLPFGTLGSVWQVIFSGQFTLPSNNTNNSYLFSANAYDGTSVRQSIPLPLGVYAFSGANFDVNVCGVVAFTGEEGGPISISITNNGSQASTLNETNLIRTARITYIRLA